MPLTRRRLIQIAGGAGGAIALSGGVAPLFPNTSSKEQELVLMGDEVAADFSFEVVSVDNRGKETKRSQEKVKGFFQLLEEDIHLEMIFIPSGSFLMGSPKDELERRESEDPQHQVAVPAFFMGKYPVTQAQWKAVAGLPPVERELDPDPSGFKGAERAVEQVSWLDAMEFCKRLSQKVKREYRLPSEAEWEYACRADTTTPFHFGETITTDLANYDGNPTYGDGPKGEWRGETTPVGSFGVANAFGLYDMHGNVWEWCADSWHENYEGAPTDGSAWIKNENDSYSRLLRGGAWFNSPWLCRSACRLRGNVGSWFNARGFRVVCAAP